MKASIKEILSGAEGRLSSKRVAAFLGIATAIYVTIEHAGSAPQGFLDSWLFFIATALGITALDRYVTKRYENKEQ